MSESSTEDPLRAFVEQYCRVCENKKCRKVEDILICIQLKMLEHLSYIAEKQHEIQRMLLS